ncbi:hypothetical protein CAPTEDRAFT_194857 [Capitella teleta]|uniref:P/Homo B domain-containing protein n=1 Tax=Capitella teleta TaxID=283909 RepID=R7T3G9_CAPTE|nr:hypothetical protein CAPTEDRAFT_194857 [Capitella teleta]|eukprot:ELT87218.1 hypothetical protein CAPTEDRAFT_194857 [Capitella teleta]
MALGRSFLLLFLATVDAVYLNKWALKITGGHSDADLLATEHGFTNLGQIGSLRGHYLFEHHDVVKRSLDASPLHHARLQGHPKVHWIEQQQIRTRVKRDPNYRYSEKAVTNLNDPLWQQMWYLHGGASGGFDLGVVGAWRKGYSGRGVVVTILDDGIEYTHDDLKQNYDPDASIDINGHDKDPIPRYDDTDENKHGTRCAGEVAATANNSKCVPGVAFNARIGGVRMLDGDVSDFVEAQALSLNPQHIDIYSASWGPDDNGKVVDGPAKLAKEAFIQGVLNGRGGKGSIYVWASGNGGSLSDSCSCDGYTNSIFTLSVSSASEHNRKPWYLEECASTLATTYSSGENYHERKVMSTDLHNGCTDKHTGTSASAPLAAGMCALALEANPELTWRDMQHIVLMSANHSPLGDGQWITNGVGRYVSHKYGYGLMNAEAMVSLAERWTTVPEQNICFSEEKTVDLAHVQAKVTCSYSRRGDLQLHLISPNGTRSTLLPRRKNDYSYGEFKDWPFMSVFYWGENPTGTWRLLIENTGSMRNTGVFLKWQLIMYGTEAEAVQLKEVSHREYDDYVDVDDKNDEFLWSEKVVVIVG